MHVLSWDLLDSSLALAGDGTSGQSIEFAFLPYLSCKMITLAGDIKRIKKIESEKVSGQCLAQVTHSTNASPSCSE